MKYKLVIFDLDGTVLDTLEDLCDSVNFALSSHKLPERSIDEVRSFVGNGIRRLIDLSVPDNTDTSIADSVFDFFKAYYKEHSSDKTKPYDGILPLLKFLREQGVRTAVVSNKADFAVKNLVEKYFDGLFDYAAGEKEGIPRKPSPDSVYNAIEFFGLSCSDCVYVGDSEVDIATAVNAGIDSIIVTWGFRDRDTLIKAGAENLCDDVSALKNMLI